jgi:hypothetical protein
LDDALGARILTCVWSTARKRSGSFVARLSFGLLTCDRDEEAQRDHDSNEEAKA